MEGLTPVYNHSQVVIFCNLPHSVDVGKPLPPHPQYYNHVSVCQPMLPLGPLNPNPAESWPRHHASPCVTVLACFFERNPRSQALTAKPHGRIEVTSILFKLILSFAFINDSIPIRARVAIVCTASLSMFFCYLLYLPYFKPYMNRLWTGFSAVCSPTARPPARFLQPHVTTITHLAPPLYACCLCDLD